MNHMTFRLNTTVALIALALVMIMTGRAETPNSPQIVTETVAKEVVKKLNDAQIGGGVRKIYIPDYKLMGGYLPQSGDKKFYHIRFNNGACGFNVGLIERTMKMRPTSWETGLRIEVAQEGAGGCPEDWYGGPGSI